MKRSVLASLLALSFAGLATNASGEISRQIELVNADDNVRIVGDYVGLIEGAYVIDTDLGELLVATDQVTCIGSACPESTEVHSARFVVLEARDRSTTIRGSLVSFDDGVYVVATRIGEIRMDTGQVNCIAGDCPDVDYSQKTLRIAGSHHAVGHLLPKLLRSFAATRDLDYVAAGVNNVTSVELRAKNGALKYIVNLTKTDDAFATSSFNDGAFDAVIVSEAAGLRDASYEVVDFAQDGVVVVTNLANQTSELSLKELMQIWSDPVTGKTIGVHVLEEDVDLIQMVRAQLGLSDTVQLPVVKHKSTQDLAVALNTNRRSFGLLRRAVARSQPLKTVSLLGDCGLPVRSDDFGLKNSDYPLRLSYKAVRRVDDGVAFLDTFTNWLSTQQAQSVIAASGFANAALSTMTIEDMGASLYHNAIFNDDFNGKQFSDMMQALWNAERLPVSLRFATGSSRLDEVSKQKLISFAQSLSDGQFADKEVVLVGFTDDVGSAFSNTQLAMRRATAVRSELSRLLPATVTTPDVVAESFGEQLPVFCNTQDIGRSLNRRVEIWVRNLSQPS